MPSISFSTFVYPRLAPFFRFFADGRVFGDIDAGAGDQVFDVVEVRTGRTVEIVARHAGGELHDDLFLLEFLALADLAREVCQFTLGRKAAANAAGQG